MSMDWHIDPIIREETIRKYLHRRLAPELVEQFEDHYLGCDECFTELRATELLIRGLGEPILERKRVNDVTVIRFVESAQLLASSLGAERAGQCHPPAKRHEGSDRLEQGQPHRQHGLGCPHELLHACRQELGCFEAAEPRCAGEEGLERHQDRFGAAELSRTKPRPSPASRPCRLRRPRLPVSPPGAAIPTRLAGFARPAAPTRAFLRGRCSIPENCSSFNCPGKLGIRRNRKPISRRSRSPLARALSSRQRCRYDSMSPSTSRLNVLSSDCR